LHFQEALLAAWRSIGRFDDQSLRAWAYRTTTRALRAPGRPFLNG
jgi:DNA-directed RNA polymerase specialized sigma24 family protein